MHFYGQIIIRIHVSVDRIGKNRNSNNSSICRANQRKRNQKLRLRSHIRLYAVWIPIYIGLSWFAHLLNLWECWSHFFSRFISLYACVRLCRWFFFGYFHLIEAPLLFWPHTHKHTSNGQRALVRHIIQASKYVREKGNNAIDVYSLLIWLMKSVGVCVCVRACIFFSLLLICFCPSKHLSIGKKWWDATVKKNLFFSFWKFLLGSLIHLFTVTVFFVCSPVRSFVYFVLCSLMFL